VGGKSPDEMGEGDALKGRQQGESASKKGGEKRKEIIEKRLLCLTFKKAH